MSEWERGFAAGWKAAGKESTESHSEPKFSAEIKVQKRTASAYSKRYGKAFKKLAPKYKTKKGSWRKGGFKACQSAAHKLARK